MADGKPAVGGLHDLAERIQSGASVRQVYGDPIEVGGRTVIPIARVAFGFGGGLGSSRESQRGITAAGEDKSAGAGGGGAATPVGVLEVTRDGVRFVPVNLGPWLIGGAVGGFVLGWLFGRRTRR